MKKQVVGSPNEVRWSDVWGDKIHEQLTAFGIELYPDYDRTPQEEHSARVLAVAAMVFADIDISTMPTTPVDFDEWLKSGIHLYSPEHFDQIIEDEGMVPYVDYVLHDINKF